MHLLTRRKFALLTAGSMAVLPPLRAARLAVTPVAGDVIDRIRTKLGDDWKADGSDGLKAGDLDTPVTGIVTTALASLQVLRSAVAGGANMVITSEPVFFSKADTPTPPVRRMPGSVVPAVAAAPAADPVFAAKVAFLKQHNMVIYRLNEHWRAQQPNPFLTGFATDMGWERYAITGNPERLSPPVMPLDALAQIVKTKLGNRGGIRVVGERSLPVRSIGFLPGSTPLQASLELLPQVDAIIAGEVREWETVEYVRDTVALGGRKALIYVGRIVSEEPGMRQCAAWLKGVVPEVPVTFMSAGDPYWRPQG